MDRDTGGMLDSVWYVAGVVADHIAGGRDSHHGRSYHPDPLSPIVGCIAEK